MEMKLKNNLYTSSSKIKRNRGIVYIAFEIIMVIFIFLVLEYGIGLFLSQPVVKDNFSPKLRAEDFYNTPKNSLNLIFLGSSHAYRGFNPTIFDKELNLKSFNMGSSAQAPIEGYYSLKDVLKYQKPKVLVYEIYWRMFEQDKYFDSKTYVYDFMKPSLNKVQFFFDAFDRDQYFDAFFLSVRYHNNWQYYVDKKPPQFSADYVGKGFANNDSVVSMGTLLWHNEFKTYVHNKYNNKQVEYFNKIIKTCKQNNIKLVLVTAPIPPTTLKMVKNYDGIHNYFQSIADKNKLKYVDYNIINQKNKLVKDTDFKDCDHLNNSGVKKIDKDFIKYIKPLYKK